MEENKKQWLPAEETLKSIVSHTEALRHGMVWKRRWCVPEIFPLLRKSWINVAMDSTSLAPLPYVTTRLGKYTLNTGNPVTTQFKVI